MKVRSELDQPSDHERVQRWSIAANYFALSRRSSNTKVNVKKNLPSLGNTYSDKIESHVEARYSSGDHN